MRVIDGAMGEGGGQVLRSSIALSMVTGQPVTVHDIRAGRKRPGLMRQHRTAVRAAAEVCGARVEGDAPGSQRLRFVPGTIRPEDYRFAVGTAGSTTLVLQTVLPALLTADGPSQLTLEGGTHNPMAPPFPFLADTFLPWIERLGPRVRATLERPGFFPAGGGRLRVEITPVPRLDPVDVLERGPITGVRAQAFVAHIPRSIGERELAVVGNKLGWDEEALEVVEVAESSGPGNVLVAQVTTAAGTETFTGFGRHGLRAESVARKVVRRVRNYLGSDAVAGEHLADQLLLPLALARGGAFTTLPLARHATTQFELIRRFLDVDFTVEEHAESATSGRTVTVRIDG